MLVRSWNLFHGNTVPGRRADRLEEMVRLVTADRPAIVCLQEVPAWAVDRLRAWSGMTSFAEVAQPPRVGPLPSNAAIGRALTSIHHGILRSAFAGQANAILTAPELRAAAADSIVLNPRRFRAAQARWLRLPLVARLAWAGERRVCHAVRVQLPHGRPGLVANLHATAFSPDRRLADAELLRAAVFADAVAAPGEVCVLAGDFNVRRGRSATMVELERDDWGFRGGGSGIDHVLVRGAEAGAQRRWPDERRRSDGLLLSDHAPVEVELA